MFVSGTHVQRSINPSLVWLAPGELSYKSILYKSIESLFDNEGERGVKWNCDALGRDPFNQNSNRSDREKRTTSKGGPVFPKLFRLDRTDPLSFGPKFPESLVEWIAPFSLFNSIQECVYGMLMSKYFFSRQGDKLTTSFVTTFGIFYAIS